MAAVLWRIVRLHSLRRPRLKKSASDAPRRSANCFYSKVELNITLALTHTRIHVYTRVRACVRARTHSLSLSLSFAHCNTLMALQQTPHTPTQECAWQRHTATHCNTLQHTPHTATYFTHCNTLQHAPHTRAQECA